MFCNALQQGDKVPLSSLYGALQGLSELGADVVRIFILPKIKIIGKAFPKSNQMCSWTFNFTGARIETHLEGTLISSVDKTASGHIKQLLIKVLAPVLKSIRDPPDNVEEYKQEYGYLGVSLYNAVIKARTQPNPVTTVPSNISSSPIPSSSSITRTVTTPTGIIQQVCVLQVFANKYFN